jgi:signal peptidase I
MPLSTLFYAPPGEGKTTLLRCLNNLETPDDGLVYVDGELLCEDYINYEDWCNMKSYGCPESVEVPEGYIFVMGDNRNHSSDSSTSAIIGFVDERRILGRVICRLTPIQKFGPVNN